LSFFNELKRRNVVRVAIAYAVAAWVLLQIADLVLENITAPPWVIQVMMLVILMGFIASVVIAWAYEMTPGGIKRQADVDRGHSITAETGHKLDRIIIGFLALAVAYFIYDKATTPELSQADPTPIPVEQTAVVSENSAEASIAVLPFVNMSDDAQNEYFSDGISEELLNVLVRVEGLRVPSRTSTFTFKGSDKKIAEIGKELNVDHVLEGSVRKSGDRIRVTAQLIDVKTDTHLWSESYTRKVDDIFAVQDEIAQAIVDSLKITLDKDKKHTIGMHSTSNVQAYNQFLLGRFLWNQRSTQSLQAAIQPFKNAVELDPQFDQAWAALAETYVLIPEYWGGSTSEFIPLSREATERTLTINPDSARALSVMAYIKASYDFDFAGSNADFERALALEPGYATAHQWYGEILAVQRRTDEALEQFRLAAKLDPLAAIIPGAAGEALFNAGRLEESLLQFELAVSISPTTAFVHGDLAFTHMLLGNYPEAREAAIESGRLNGISVTAELATIDALENPELTDKAIAEIARSNLPDAVWGKAIHYAALGEYELALENLELGFETGDPYAVRMNSMVIFDPLRETPRFQALLAKMNLWP
jgi:adenylate cyclase